MISMIRQNLQCYSFVLMSVFCFLLVAPLAEAQNVTDWINDSEQDQNEEEIRPDTIESNNEEPSFIWSLIKLVGILIIMIGLLYVAVRFFSKRNRQIRDLNLLENMGGISVGQQKSIQLIRVGHTYYMIGVGDNVELLQEITDESIIKELDLMTEEPKEHAFFSALNRMKQTNNEQNSSSSFTHIYEKELDSVMNNRKNMIRSHQQRDKDNE